MAEPGDRARSGKCCSGGTSLDCLTAYAYLLYPKLTLTGHGAPALAHTTTGAATPSNLHILRGGAVAAAGRAA